MLKSAYRSVVDHLTKLLGAVGAGIMSVAAIDPEPIRAAAQQYLPNNWVAKVGMVLFALVVLRGWYTGLRAKELAEKK